MKFKPVFKSKTILLKFIEISSILFLIVMFFVLDGIDIFSSYILITISILIFILFISFMSYIYFNKLLYDIRVLQENLHDRDEFTNKSKNKHTFSTEIIPLANLISKKIISDDLNSLKKNFINTAAHELRTPTQLIIGYVELLNESINTNTTDIYINKLCQTIYNAAHRLEKLTNDILDTIKIENNKIKLSYEFFNVSDSLSCVIEEFNNNPISVNINIELESDKKKTIYADKIRFEQVIYNLLSNSIKSIKECKINGDILISQSSIFDNKNKEHLLISVKDNGLGIDEKILPDIFKKFVTTFSNGVGLGLYLSKIIIESHKGKIWAENNYNESGSCFYLTIPCKEK